MITRARIRGAAGSRRFSPASLSGLRYWFDADRLTGLSDGAQIPAMTDLSGVAGDLSQGTASLRALYETGDGKGGKAVARFDGVDDVFTSGQAASYWKPLHDGTGCTFWLAFKSTNATAYQELLSTGGWSSSNVGVSVGRNGTNSRLDLYVMRGVAGQPAIQTNTGNSTIAINTPYVVALRFQSVADNVTVWINGSKIVQSAWTNAPSSSNPTFTAATRTGNYYFKGDYYAAAISFSACADAIVDKMNAYLQDRWV